LTSAPLRIGPIARAAGVSPDTLRHYERRGLLSRVQRSASGYRLYPKETVDQVRRIRNAIAIGFTIDELSKIFKVRDKGGAPCSEVRTMAAQKLSALEARIEEMVRLQHHLKKVIRQWDVALKSTPAGQKARLLESIMEVRK
jgi:DNA-binding transcriptional MerR regulator